MLQHNEIDSLYLLSRVTKKQRDILIVIADYDQGYITEQQLEDKLTKIIRNTKKNNNE